MSLDLAGWLNGPNWAQMNGAQGPNEPNIFATINIFHFRRPLLANKSPEAAAPVARACFDNYPQSRMIKNYP